MGTYKSVPQIARSGNLHGNQNYRYREISRTVKRLSMNNIDEVTQLITRCPNWINF